MSKTALIAPVDNILGITLFHRLLRSNYSVVAGYTGDEFRVDVSEYEDRCVTQAWNPRSYVSGRSLVLETLNRFGHIDAAMLVAEAGYPDEAVHEMSPLTIERGIDSSALGPVLLAREMLAALIKQGTGRLSLVTHIPEDQTPTLLANIAASAMSALGESLMVEYGDRSIAIDTFESKKTDVPGYAEFILSVDGRNGDGKIHRFGAGVLPKLSLRGR